MYFKKNLQFKEQYDKQINTNKKSECEVSRASSEIMLHRVFNGYEIDFPFAK